MSNYSDSSFDDSNKNTSWYKVFARIPEKAIVLDIGCSSGNFGAALIQRKDCVVDGVELDKSDVRLAAKKLRKVYNLNVEADNLAALKPGSYDIIYFGDVIEHLVDPAKALARIQPLLKKGGKLVFSIPNMAYIGVRLALLEGDFDYTETGILDKTHLHFYTQAEIVRVFNEAGYEVTGFDFVEKDYPKALLKSKLKKLGLRADDVFLKNMAKTEASAFQFIGEARPSLKKIKVKRQVFGPVDLFETFYNDTVAGHKQQVAELERQIKQLKEQISFKEKHPYRSMAGHYKKKVKIS